MALGIPKIQPTGALATYHRIDRIEINYGTRQAWVHVAGYLDKSAADSGYTPLTQTTFDISQTPDLFATPEKPQDANVTRAFAYDLVKEDAYFAGAEEV
jgi:hypothetical protein